MHPFEKKSVFKYTFSNELYMCNKYIIVFTLNTDVELFCLCRLSGDIYSFLCFMAKSAFWRGFSVLSPYTGVGPIQCFDEICNVPPPLHTLKIWGAGVYSPRRYRAKFLFFVFFCLSVTLRCQAQKAWTVRIRIELGGNGHKHPGQKHPRTKVPPGKRPPGQAATYSVAAVAGN